MIKKIWEKLKEIYNAESGGVVGKMTPIGNTECGYGETLAIIRDDVCMKEVNRRLNGGK